MVSDSAMSAGKNMTDQGGLPDVRSRHPDGFSDFGVTLLDQFALRRGHTDIPLPLGCQRLVASITLANATSRAMLGGTSRAVLGGSLWPDVSDERASGNLRSMVWRVHRLAPGLIQSRGAALSLSP